MAILLDAYGNPVQSKMLTQPAEIRTIPTQRVQEVDPATITKALKAAEEGRPGLLVQLGKRIEKRELHLRAVLATRKLQVKALPITVEAVGDDSRAQADADLVRTVLAGPDVSKLIFDLLDGLMHGLSIVETVWSQTAKIWRPVRFQHRDLRLFFFRAPDFDTPLLIPEGGQETDAAPLPPYRFLVHRPTLLTGPALESGFVHAAVWAYMFKTFTLRDWVTFVEAYGTPIRFARYPANISDTDKQKLAQAVMGLARDFAALVPVGTDLQIINGPTQASSDLYLALVSYIDQQLSKLILGQTATTDAIAGGHAVGREHNEVRGDIEAADAADLAATLMRDLVRPLIDLNHGPPPTGEYPVVRLAKPEATDIAAITDAVTKLLPFGFRVQGSVMADRLGLPDPDPDADPEDMLRPASAAAAAPLEPPPSDPAKPPPSRNARQFMATSVPPRDRIDPMIERAEREAHQEIDPWIAEIRALLSRCQSLEEFQGRLLDLYRDLPIDQLAAQIGRAMMAADLSGRADGR
jgi:phage gp29-like protein